MGATVTLTPVAVFSMLTTPVLVLMSMPCFLKTFSMAMPTSSSSTGRMRGIISMTVTLVPKVW